MSIWQHSDPWMPSSDEPSPASWAPEELRKLGEFGWTVPACLYCDTVLNCLGNDGALQGISSKPAVHVCPRCGWWLVSLRRDQNRGSEGEIHLHRTWGQLRALDLSDIAAPLSEVQDYLVAKYADRFSIHPRKYEELVASVFKGLGYRVRVTSFSKDDGIDIFVLDGTTDTVGVQVKRYRNKIEAEQIRAFAGALLLEGLTQGVYVTTSTYRRGAGRTARKYKKLGLAIELWDANAFYDRPQITQRPIYESYEDDAVPFYQYTVAPDSIPLCWTHGW